MVVFVYCDEVYYLDEFDNKGLVELILSKNCYGVIGVVELVFFGEMMSFCNFECYVELFLGYEDLMGDLDLFFQGWFE